MAYFAKFAWCELHYWLQNGLNLKTKWKTCFIRYLSDLFVDSAPLWFILKVWFRKTTPHSNIFKWISGWRRQMYSNVQKRLTQSLTTLPRTEAGALLLKWQQPENATKGGRNSSSQRGTTAVEALGRHTSRREQSSAYPRWFDFSAFPYFLQRGSWTWWT